MSRIIGLVYLVVGIVVAASKNYLENLDNIQGILSAILAVVLWPLVLVGVDLHLDNGKGKRNSLGQASLAAAFLPVAAELIRSRAASAIERTAGLVRR